MSRIAKLRAENEDLEVYESFSLYELSSSKVVSLEEFKPQMLWRGSREQHITMLCTTMSPLLKPPKVVAEERTSGCIEKRRDPKVFPDDDFVLLREF